MTKAKTPATTSPIKEIEPKSNHAIELEQRGPAPVEVPEEPDRNDRIVRQLQNANDRGKTYVEVPLQCAGCDNPDCPSCGTRNEKALQRENRVLGGSGRGGGGGHAKKIAVRGNRVAQRVDEKETIPTNKYSLTLHPKFHAAFERADEGLEPEVQPWELPLFVADHFGFVLRTLPRRVTYGNVNGVLVDPRDVLESGSDGDYVIAPPKRKNGKPGKMSDRSGGRPTIFPSQGGIKLDRRMPCEQYDRLRATYATPPKDDALGERDLDAARIHLGFQVGAGEIQLQQGRNVAADARPGHNRPRDDDEDARALASVTRADFDRMQRTVPDELAQLRDEARQLYANGMSAHRIAHNFHDRDGRRIWDQNTILRFLECDNPDCPGCDFDKGLWRRSRRPATPAEEKLATPKRRRKT